MRMVLNRLIFLTLLAATGFFAGACDGSEIDLESEFQGTQQAGRDAIPTQVASATPVIDSAAAALEYLEKMDALDAESIAALQGMLDPTADWTQQAVDLRAASRALLDLEAPPCLGAFEHLVKEAAQLKLEAAEQIVLAEAVSDASRFKEALEKLGLANDVTKRASSEIDASGC